MKKTLAALGAVCLAGVAFAAPASADPVNAKNALHLTLSCANAGTYEVVVSSSGRWSPALSTTSNQVFHPTAFGEETFTVHDAQTDEVLFSQTENTGDALNAKKNGQDRFVCDFRGTTPIFFDPEAGTDVYVEISGEVLGTTKAA